LFLPRGSQFCRKNRPLSSLQFIAGEKCGAIDTGEQFIAGVVDTGEEFITFFPVVIDTGQK
jgi:hypothetical protein